jgi:uncharacterized Zn finger protein (UPF0148 family)
MFNKTQIEILEQIKNREIRKRHLERELDDINADLYALGRAFAVMTLGQDTCPKCGGNLLPAGTGEVACLQCGKAISIGGG